LDVIDTFLKTGTKLKYFKESGYGMTN